MGKGQREAAARSLHDRAMNEWDVTVIREKPGYSDHFTRTVIAAGQKDAIDQTIKTLKAEKKIAENDRIRIGMIERLQPQ
jgi:hypothetical protein